jgi:hypothetical protein
MSDQLLDRSLFAAMASVLIVPELATFVILSGMVVAGFGILLAGFVRDLLRDAEPSGSHSGSLIGVVSSEVEG